MTQQLMVSRGDLDAVSNRVKEYQGRKELDLPADYSVGNAMQSAWLILQKTLDKDKKPVLTTCSKASILNSLFDMIVQGLNPAKDQCYFIAYGHSLACQRSYFGTMAVAERFAHVRSYPNVIYEGDDFEYGMEDNFWVIKKHTQKLENRHPDKIRGAYCLVTDMPTGKPVHLEVMTMEQIKKSWKMSKMNPNKEDSTHHEFPDQMAIRTVVGRALKPFINRSNDSALFQESYNRADELAIEAEFTEVSSNANATMLEFPVDVRTAEDLDAPPAPPEDTDCGTVTVNPPKKKEEQQSKAPF